MSRKGQVAVEFFIYAGVFLAIAIMAFSLTTFTERGEVALRESQYFHEFGQRFSYASTIAFRGGEGFVYDFYFPGNIDGKPYGVYFVTEVDHTGAPERSSVIVNWTGTYQEYVYSYMIPAADYDPVGGSCASTYSYVGHTKVVQVDVSGGRMVLNNTNGEDIKVSCGVEE